MSGKLRVSDANDCSIEFLTVIVPNTDTRYHLVLRFVPSARGEIALLIPTNLFLVATFLANLDELSCRVTMGDE